MLITSLTVSPLKTRQSCWVNKSWSQYSWINKLIVNNSISLLLIFKYTDRWPSPTLLKPPPTTPPFHLLLSHNTFLLSPLFQSPLKTPPKYVPDGKRPCSETLPPTPTWSELMCCCRAQGSYSRPYFFFTSEEGRRPEFCL